MFELKPLSKKGIPGALEKAMRYRLLNEPRQAESICRDVLETDPENQEALVTLILAITDQFGEGLAGYVKEAQELIPQLRSEYEQAYYQGIICERQAKNMFMRNSPEARYFAYDGLKEAMSWYEKAEKLRPEGNDDPILRWNACARIIMRNKLGPKPPEERHLTFLE